MSVAPRNDDVTVVRGRRREFGDELVRARVLRVPESEKFPGGLKCAFHYGQKGADDPISRYNNHHGTHERHKGEDIEEIEFPGAEQLLRRFIEELPDDISPY